MKTKQAPAPQLPARIATVREAAEYLRVSIDTVYRMVNANGLKAHRVRGAIRIPWDAIHAL